MTAAQKLISILAAVLMLVAIHLLIFYERQRNAPPAPEGRVDTLVVHDTVIRLVKQTLIRHDTLRFPAIVPERDSTAANDSTAAAPRDSALVAIPIVQRVFEGEYYRAVVQGYEPELVGIDIFLQQPPEEKRKARLGWSVGFQVGFGFTPAGWQPYAGVGITAGVSF